MTLEVKIPIPTFSFKAAKIFIPYVIIVLEQLNLESAGALTAYDRNLYPMSTQLLSRHNVDECKCL